MMVKLQPIKAPFFCVGLVVAIMSLAAHAEPDTNEAPLFLNQSTLNIEITGPLSTLMRERSVTEYLDGKLSYSDKSGALHELDLKFRARGNYRRRRDICKFPPIRLNLEKKQLAGTEFADQNILKLVGHCSPGSKRYEQLVLKEYLAYKILEMHSPYSFRTRLLKISWVDTDKGNKVTERYGFVIEHKKQLSSRLGSTVADVQSTRHSRLDREQASIVSVFQYLIGNTDYSLVKGTPDNSCCHNGVLLAKGESEFLPIPYDFDFAGIVSAPYAEPNPSLPISRVTTRLYRGHCSVKGELPATLSMFQQKMSQVLELIETQEGLNDRERGRAMNFINKFYSEIADQEKIERKFTKKCS